MTSNTTDLPTMAQSQEQPLRKHSRDDDVSDQRQEEPSQKRQHVEEDNPYSQIPLDGILFQFDGGSPITMEMASDRLFSAALDVSTDEDSDSEVEQTYQRHKRHLQLQARRRNAQTQAIKDGSDMAAGNDNDNDLVHGSSQDGRNHQNESNNKQDSLSTLDDTAYYDEEILAPSLHVSFPLRSGATTVYVALNKKESIVQNPERPDEMLFKYEVQLSDANGTVFHYIQEDKVARYDPDVAPVMGSDGKSLTYTVPKFSLPSIKNHNGDWRWHHTDHVFTRPDGQTLRAPLIQRTFEVGTNKYVHCTTFGIGKFLALDINTCNKGREKYGRFFSNYHKTNNTKNGTVQRPQWSEFERQLVYCYFNQLVANNANGILSIGNFKWEDAAKWINHIRGAMGYDNGERTASACQSLWNKTSNERDPIFHSYKQRWQAFAAWSRNGEKPHERPPGSISELIVFEPVDELKELLGG